MSLLKKIFFAWIAVVLFFGVLEALSFIVFWANPRIGRGSELPLRQGPLISDGVVHHKWKPSIRHLDRVREEHYYLITNKQSWVEEYDVEENKPPSVYRIFYVGDSNVQGVVAPSSKMVEIVESELNERYKRSGMKIEVINTGTASYSPLIYHVLIKERLLPYSPDLVVINLDMTDVANDAFYRERIVEDPDGEIAAVSPVVELGSRKIFLTPQGAEEASPLESLGALLKEESKFYRLLWISSKSFLSRRKLDRRAVKWLPWQRERDHSGNWLAHEWSAEVEESVEFSMELLSKTVKLLRRRDVAVFVTGVPHYPQYTGRWSKRPHRELGIVAEKHGFLYLNSLEALEERISGTPVWEFYWKSDPTHFNANGNRYWAGAQLEFMLEHREELLPPLEEGHGGSGGES